jgi:hypothetical protein
LGERPPKRSIEILFAADVEMGRLGLRLILDSCATSPPLVDDRDKQDEDFGELSVDNAHGVNP